MKTFDQKETSDQNAWDTYWNDKDKPGNVLYDLIAAFYRKFIIKNILNYFIYKHFPKGDKVLHAGCGSGMVDEDQVDRLQITALDISTKALDIYKRIHGEKCEVVHGSIFAIPFADGTFDGVYNLGVMEHFTEEEISSILFQFKKVLKEDSKIVILWPPVFGLTVQVLDSIHFIANRIFRLGLKLHPEEITRIRSKRHAIEVFEKADFEVIEYYFGIRDFFTQVVIVARPNK